MMSTVLSFSQLDMATLMQEGCKNIFADPVRHLRHNHYRLAHRYRKHPSSHNIISDLSMDRYIELVRQRLRNRLKYLK